MGLRRIEEKLTQEAETKRKSAELALKSLETMSKKVHELHVELKKLENKYQEDIKKNPELAQHLMKLREELGLPRAMGIYEVAKKPSFIDRIKGKDDYHNFIALRILELGKKLQNQTGGLVSISELALRLNDENQGITIAINDINTALDLLKSNGMIHSIRQLSRIRVVEFFDPNLSEDHQVIIELAARSQGEIGLTEIVQETSWNIDRINQALSTLIQKKIAIKTQTLDGIIFSFPGI